MLTEADYVRMENLLATPDFADSQWLPMCR